MTRPAISGVAIDTLLFSRIRVPLFHRYRIVSRSGTHAAFRGMYMRRLHAFLEESDEESVRQHHRRCARETAARMSPSSGRDSADGTADVSTRCIITHRIVSRAQRPRKSVRGGGGSSRASDTVSLPQSEACTVQVLMDLALPRFAGLGDEPRQVHEPWAILVASPASPATSRLDTSGEEDRAGLSSPCLNLDGLSSSDDDTGASVGLSDLSVTLLCGSDEVFPLSFQIRSSRTWMAQFNLNNVRKRGLKHHHFISRTWTFHRSLWRAISDRLSGYVTSR